MVRKTAAVGNLDHLINPSIARINAINCRAITAYWAMVPNRDGSGMLYQDAGMRRGAIAAIS
jgi:hypothetical protein